MSFTLNRDINNRAIKKNVTVSNIINPDSLKASIGTTGRSDFVILNTLNLNNTQVTATAEQLNYLQVNPGIAEASKALVLNSSRNISGINILTLNSNIIVNGQAISSNADLGGGVSDDLNNPYLTNITPGIALSSKALILNSAGGINNINNLSLSNLNINNYNIKLTNNEPYNMESISTLTNPNSSLINNLFTFSNRFGISSIFENLNGLCWSEDLEMLVAIITNSSNNNMRIIYSMNGINWNNATIPSGLNSSWSAITWSSDLGLFVAVGNNNIITSSDGINWTTGSLPVGLNLRSICWSPELGLFVAIVSDASNNIPALYSTDGINWNIANTIGQRIQWSSICWANKLNMFIAVASGTSNSAYINRIMISTDGINWTLISHPLTNSVSCQSICWSEDLNMFIITTSSTPNKILRSNDGVSWFPSYSSNDFRSIWTSRTINSCIWIRELNQFIATTSYTDFSNSAILLRSFDGIRWSLQEIGVNSRNTEAIVWSNKLGGIFCITNSGSVDKNIHSSKFIKTTTSSFKGFIFNNQITSRIGINTQTPKQGLEISHETGLCLKFKSTQFNRILNCNITSDGQLNLESFTNTTTPFNINIQTDFSTYGLKLNNILLTPTINQYGYLTNITDGIASASKLLILDSSRNINNLNLLSCSSLIVNGNSITDENNNGLIKDLIVGSALPSKALLVDNNRDIVGINKIITKKLDLNYNILYGSKISENINLFNLYNKNQNIPINYIINKLQPTNWIQTIYNTATWNDMCWSPELNLYVIVGTNSRIMVSTNGYSWTEVMNNTLYDASMTLNSIAWSSTLNTFVVLATTSSNTLAMIISNDGYSWGRVRNTATLPTFTKVIWISELKIFVAIANRDGIARVFISRDGLFWNPSTLSKATCDLADICWCDKLNMIAISSHTHNTIFISYDAINWTEVTINNIDTSNTGYINICWSTDLNLCIATRGRHMVYSYNGLNWFYFYGTLNINQFIWAKELKLFIGAGGSSQPFTYSLDGFNWTSLTTPTVPSETSQWNRIFWFPDSSLMMSLNASTTKRIAYNIIGLPNSTSYLYAHQSQLYFDKINGRMGIGTTNPAYQLHLSSDNAAKPSSNSWTIASDQRLKENIENADLNICYDIIKNLDLKRYTWKQNIVENKNIYDKTKLGWLADDVELVFPKAVNYKNLFNISDCKILNIDQILASVYGCSQQLININDDLENATNDLFDEVNKIEIILNSL